jgi:hypothetical protein
MIERTAEQVGEELAEIEAIMTEQAAYVDMLRTTYRRARAELTAQRRDHAELLAELRLRTAVQR